MIEIVLVRHGETKENVKRLCQGQSEGTLTENGVKQNELLAEKLKEFLFETIYTSPLNRAEKTAKQISKFHANTPFVIDDRLKELNFGVLQGKPFPKGASPFDAAFQGESFEEIKNRVKSFVDFIKNKHDNCAILVVSHGVTIKIFEHILTEEPFSILNVQKNSTEKIFLIENE